MIERMFSVTVRCAVWVRPFPWHASRSTGLRLQGRRLPKAPRFARMLVGVSQVDLNARGEAGLVGASQVVLLAATRGTRRSRLRHPATTAHLQEQPRRFERDLGFPSRDYRVPCARKQAAKRCRRPGNRAAVAIDQAALLHECLIR
jgi:hypothetical protein